MVYENDKKRMDVERDRLSSLPDDLIHKILSFNDTRDAVKASALSSRWRFIWTTMPCLAFSGEDYATCKYSKFVNHVLSGRDNEREVTSVRLSFCAKDIQLFVKTILDYAFSHNVQQLNLTCFYESDVQFPLSLFSSQSLKHFTLKADCYYRSYDRGSVTLTSMWEVPALTTLHLDRITLSHDNLDNFSGRISMCVNLKNLTLSSCKMIGSELNICHPQLANLNVEYLDTNGKVLSVVSPQLKNLNMRRFSGELFVSAPDLACLNIRCYNSLKLSAHDLHSLETVDICISYPYKQDPKELVGLLQCLHSVKFLTLNMEILEILSSSVELISHQPSPFANLKRLKVYPDRVDNKKLMKEKAEIPIEVKNYLLNSSPHVTFVMVSHEEIMTEMNTMSAYRLMANLRVLLGKEKAENDVFRDEQQKTQIENQGNMADIGSCWDGLSEQIEQGKKKIDSIFYLLRHIKYYLRELPALHRAVMQPRFSSLCAEADTVISEIKDCMKTQFDENQSRVNACLYELATAL